MNEDAIPCERGLIMGILWDLDGVLVDTAEFHYQTWSTVLAEYEISYSREIFQATFGRNNLEVLSTLLGKHPDLELVANISNRKEQLFRKLIVGHVKLMSGAHFWLQHFKLWGLHQAIASSAPQANIEALVDELKIRDFFNGLVSGDRMPAKPDPAIFLEAARVLRISPERCLVIEDAVAGINGAKRAGMKTIAVTTTHPTQALHEADWIVDSLTDIHESQMRQMLSGAF